MSEQDVFDALKYRIEVDQYGTRKYYNKAGQLHRINGPAIEYADGTKYWYQNSLIHRTDGPAIEYADGEKYWYQNGLLHRTDGAAIERCDGIMECYINGEELTAAQFKLAVKSL